ncbi:MAG: hypothetical protein EBY22_17430, partial [Gammaproteobacteria bacterium]|nr:hypothetical protein [Gammaproteobacteria bacterium]
MDRNFYVAAENSKDVEETISRELMDFKSTLLGCMNYVRELIRANNCQPKKAFRLNQVLAQYERLKKPPNKKLEEKEIAFSSLLLIGACQPRNDFDRELVSRDNQDRGISGEGPLSYNEIYAQRRHNKFVSGNDNRAPIDINVFPYSSIGRLNTTPGQCTASVVGRRLLLTAAHCLKNERTNTIKNVSDLHFELGRDLNKVSKFFKIKTVMMSDKYLGVLEKSKVDVRQNFILHGPAVSENDWAFLETFEDIDAQPIKITDQIILELLAQRSGYGAERPTTQMGVFNCTLNKVRDYHLIQDTCSAQSGDSGSPILQKNHDEYQICLLYTSPSPRDR